jgi:hypothetical protein
MMTSEYKCLDLFELFELNRKLSGKLKMTQKRMTSVVVVDYFFEINSISQMKIINTNESIIL